METGRKVKDVSPHEFVKAYASHLKRSGKMELPHWTDIVKTATFKELPPYDPDWYFVRAASMARKIYLRQGIGVGGFRKIYGGRQRNGSRPPHFCKSSGAIARNILQQLEKMNIVEMDTKGGRRITSSGQRDLDQVTGRRVGVVSTPISTGNAVQSPRNLCGLPAVKSSTEIVLVDEAEGEKVNRLKTSYLDIIVPMLVEKFSYNNVYEVPKVVVKCDMEDAGRNPKVMETAMLNLELLTGQRPMKTRSRVLDANFKLRDSKPGRTAVTLRGNMMYSFLDRLINLLLPGTMDLRDVKPNSFDGHGNYRFRLHEQSMFPEIRYDTVTKGIDVCITTTAKTDKEAQQLLSLMGMPCKIKWMS